MAFSLKMVLNSLRTGSDPAAFALKSITSMSTDGDTELHTHINHLVLTLSCPADPLYLCLARPQKYGTASDLLQKQSLEHDS